MSETMGDRLQDGSRVCIIGGGPAGSFAALHLLRLARERSLHLEVEIFEPRDGRTQGPRSCKGCAGILSHGAVHNLASLGLQTPPEVVQSELRSYVVHVQNQAATVDQPHRERRILSVYRGAGPRLRPGPSLAGFDAWLLDQARAAGARVIPTYVRRVAWDGRPIIYGDAAPIAADLLVLAIGVNSRHPLSSKFEYAPPQTAIMAQDEIVRPASWPDGKVAGFFGGLPGLVFGALVPKGPYLNVSLLWPGAEADAIVRFYTAHAQALARFFAERPASLCGCLPLIAVRPARTYFGDRWVAVGDAAVTRLYKDGINSAFLTAGAAMAAAVEVGTTAAAFAAAYAPACRQLAADNRYGELIFRTCQLALQSSLLARACIGCVRAEAGGQTARRIFSRLVWGMLTGDESYRDLFRLLLSPVAWSRLAREAARVLRERR